MGLPLQAMAQQFDKVSFPTRKVEQTTPTIDLTELRMQMAATILAGMLANPKTTKVQEECDLLSRALSLADQLLAKQN